MRKVQLCLSLCLVTFMIGCTGRPVTRVSNGFVDEINKPLRDAQTSSTPGDAKQKRNEAIEYVVARFDANYEDFVRDLEAKRSRANFIADVIEISSSAAIGITKGSQRTIQIMGIALTAFRGGRKSADLEFFKEQTTAVLISKMDDGRAKVYAGMLKKMKEQDINEYPTASAVIDLVAYYNAGTLVRAFTQLSKDTAAEAQHSEAAVRDLKLPLSKIATKEEAKLATDASDVLFNLKSALGKEDQKADATAKLQKIVAEIEPDKAFEAALKDADVTSKTTEGEKIRTALVTIRRNARNLQSYDLLNKINKAIVDNGQ
jgi:hypothetical protein